MTVQSKEIKEAKDEQPAAIGGAWSVGVVLLAFGVPGWLAGGRYTVDGWVVWLNWFSTWLHIPASIPRIAGWGLLLVLPVAYIYSQVEVTHRPVRRVGSHWRSAGPLFWAAWLLIVATDVGSTYQGVRAPAPGAWEITRQVAAEPWLAFFWASILTFAPERLIIGGIRLLGK